MLKSPSLADPAEQTQIGRIDSSVLLADGRIFDGSTYPLGSSPKSTPSSISTANDINFVIVSCFRLVERISQTQSGGTSTGGRSVSAVRAHASNQQDHGGRSSLGRQPRPRSRSTILPARPPLERTAQGSRDAALRVAVFIASRLLRDELPGVHFEPLLEVAIV